MTLCHILSELRGWVNMVNNRCIQAEVGPPCPWLSSPGERERNAAMARTVGSICCSSVQSPTHLSYNTFRNPFEPFQIKWEVYFSKELCPLVFIVSSLCFRMYMCMYNWLWLCNRYNRKQSDGEKCWVPLHCHRSQVRSGPEWLHLTEFRGQRELFDI